MSKSLVEEEGKVREERRRSRKEMRNCNKRKNTKNRKYHCKPIFLILWEGLSHVGALLRMREQDRYEMASGDGVLVEDALYQQAR